MAKTPAQPPRRALDGRYISRASRDKPWTPTPSKAATRAPKAEAGDPQTGKDSRGAADRPPAS
jgi:hypothetical protein